MLLFLIYLGEIEALQRRSTFTEYMPLKRPVARFLVTILTQHWHFFALLSSAFP